MTTEFSDRPSSPVDARERMQRVRVGVTGLAAVVLVVALATAVGSGIRKRASESAAISGPPPVAATVNAAEEKTEPLTQLGVTPDAKSDAAKNGKPTN